MKERHGCEHLKGQDNVSFRYVTGSLWVLSDGRIEGNLPPPPNLVKFRQLPIVCTLQWEELRLKGDLGQG